MERQGGQLTVYFEDPFWVGVFERIENGQLSVCKVTFGAEPKDCEVYDFVLDHHHELTFSSSVEADVRQQADNPKRRLREAGKQMRTAGISTRSQMALQLQREEMKNGRKQLSRQQQEAEDQRRFLLRREKRKEKQKGH